jgi:hypothetical protein
MQFKKILAPVLSQLVDSIQQLDKIEYTQKSLLLNGSTIGGHTRHVIELFQCLITGYADGIVNYEHRKRDYEIETNKDVACSILKNLVDVVNLPNKPLTLKGFYSQTEDENCTVDTNYHRELIYNLEHTIHHMALIRVAINEVSNIILPQSFGVASATIQYQKTCVQ